MLNTLFPLDPIGPNGFSYFPDFISPGQEAMLLKIVREIDVQPMIFQGFEAKRKTKSFGYDYHFDSRRLVKGLPVPESLNDLVYKVSAPLSIDPKEFAEVLVTEYPPGSVINWHRDAPPFQIIAGISLLSDCTFRFRPHEKSKQGRNTILSIPVERRSLYVLDGESRTDWEHSISPVANTRYSITLRTLRPS